MIHTIPVRIDAIIEVEINPDVDSAVDSFDLLFDQIQGNRVQISNGSFVFDAEVRGLGLIAGRKVTFKL